MTSRSRHDADTRVIANLLAARRRAHRERDAAMIVAPLAPDALIYDLAPPLANRGRDAVGVAAWLASWDGPIDLNDHDTEISVDGTVAFVTGLTRMRGEKEGVVHDIWLRATTCLRKSGDRWWIVHEHTSVPFYMDGSLRAAVDLQP